MLRSIWKITPRLLGGLMLLPVLGLFVATAQAHPTHQGHAFGFGGPKTCMMISHMDEDGGTSAEEAKKMHEKPFNFLDGNGDGKITKKEFVSEAAREKARKKWREERRAKRFAKMDKNGDGKVTLDEFSAAHAGRMEKMHGAMMHGGFMEGFGPMMHGDFRHLGHDIRRLVKRARHHAMMGLCGDQETDDSDQ